LLAGYTVINHWGGRHSSGTIHRLDGWGQP
jgi:hypothetical protein